MRLGGRGGRGFIGYHSKTEEIPKGETSESQRSLQRPDAGLAQLFTFPSGDIMGPWPAANSPNKVSGWGWGVAGGCLAGLEQVGEQAPKGRSKAQPGRKSAARLARETSSLSHKNATQLAGDWAQAGGLPWKCQELGDSSAPHKRGLKRGTDLYQLNLLMPTYARHCVRCHRYSIMFLPKGNAQRMSEQGLLAKVSDSRAQTHSTGT